MKFIYRSCYNVSIFQLIFITTFIVVVYLSIFYYFWQDNGKSAWKDRKAIADYPGEMGAPVHLSHKQSKIDEDLIKRGWQKHKFNEFVSNLIPVNRSLPDARDESCQQAARSWEQLPVTDVIICFHNEAWSTLLRTVHSVLNRSPDHLIGQIILVDDQSIEDYLQQPLDMYFSRFPKVKIVRATRRLGIAGARVLGMKYSTAAVLTYLDSHCECLEGWLEPLLERIALNPSNVVVPSLDFIDKETFEVVAPPLTDEQFIGGFSWNLEYTWFQYFAENAMAPVATPTMAGGIFSIDRKFFDQLGTYDAGFRFWGAENLELSFKTWMCGGHLETVPCSRVAHVFRDEFPYEYPEADEVITNNLVRLAKVWMDDYAQIFYASRGLKFNTTPAASIDVSESMLMRKKLGCNTFKWYLENIYPEKFVPTAFGAIVQNHKNLCLEVLDERGYVDVRDCHDRGENQFWMIGNLGEIRKDEICLSAINDKPTLMFCTEASEQGVCILEHTGCSCVNHYAFYTLTIRRITF